MEEMLSRPYAMDGADPDFMPGINRYPDFLNVTVSNRIAARHGVSSGQVIACCGFSELAYMCSQAFLPTGKHLLMPELSYRLPAFYAQQCGKGVHTARMDSAHGIDLMAMLEEVDPDTGLIYLANPNNPTGSLLALDDLESFLSLAARKSPEAVFLIDEAYVDYVQQSPAPEAIPLCTRFRAVVGRTFSKAFGLAGLRAGYAIAGSELGLELNGFLSGYLGGDTGWRMFEGNINRLAESAVLASLSGEGLAFVESVRTRNADLRDLLDRGLSGFGFDPLPSHANFMLVDVKSRGENLRRCLFGRKILVQAGESFHSSLRNCIRVSVGSRDEIDAFLEALAAYDPARAYPECLPVFYHGI